MMSFKSSLCAAVFVLLPVGLAAQQRGPIEQQHVDPASAARGQALYRISCASCHGTRARGTAAGVDLMRSTVVQHDLYGSTLGPFLHQGHAPNTAELSAAQLLDLSNFLHQEFDATLSRSPAKPAPDILVGDAAAGQAWFNGAGQCSTCHSTSHSTSGDLAGIATRYADPYALQQRFVFPGGFHRGGSAAEAKRTAVTVTITSAAGPPVIGDLVSLDDFTIIYRDAQGHTQTVQRTPGMTVTEHNPLAYHEGLLKTMTDRQMHNMLAYLETLK